MIFSFIDVNQSIEIYNMASSIIFKPLIINGVSLYTFKEGHKFSIIIKLDNIYQFHICKNNILPIDNLMARNTIGCKSHENFWIWGFQSIFLSYYSKLIFVNIECQKHFSILKRFLGQLLQIIQHGGAHIIHKNL